MSKMVVVFAITISALCALSSGMLTANLKVFTISDLHLFHLLVAAEPISTPALFSRQVSSNIPSDCLTNQCIPVYDALGAVRYSSRFRLRPLKLFVVGIPKELLYPRLPVLDRHRE
jgi:hypothetical protein